MSGTTPDPSGTVPGPADDGPARSASDADGRPGAPGAARDTGPASCGAVPIDIRAMADLLPAARAARAALTASGRALSREALADRMREDGHAVSNARASLLRSLIAYDH